MNGPEHYRAAEFQIEQVEDAGSLPMAEVAARMQVAQVHATLALAAATAVGQHGVAPKAVDNNDGSWAKVLRSAARERGAS